MPLQIPTYESKKQLTVSEPVSSRPQMGSEVFESSGRGLSALGQTISAIGENFRSAKATQQRMEASNLAQQQLKELQFQAQDDTGVELLGKYLPQIEKIKQETIKGIQYPDAQEKFNNDFSTWSLNTEYFVRDKERRNIIDRGTATFEESLNIKKNSFYETANPTEKLKIRNIELPLLIDEAVGAGYITATDGEKRLQNINNEIVEGQINYDINTNPILAFMKFENGDYNSLKKINAPRWSQLKAIAKNNAENEKTKNEKILEGQYYAELNKSPEAAKQKLEGGLYGIKDSNPKLWRTLKNAANAEIEKIKKARMAKEELERLEQENESENEILKMYNEGSSSKEILEKVFLYDSMRKIGEIDKDFPQNIVSLVNNRDEIESTATDKPSAYNEIKQKFLALPFDRDGKTVSSAATLKAMVQFKKDLLVVQASKEPMTQSTFQSWLQRLDTTYREKLQGIIQTKFSNGKAISGFWSSLLTSGERGLPLAEQQDAMMYMDKSLMKFLDENPKISNEDLVIEAKNIFKNYMTQEYPEIMGLDEIPNSVYTPEEGLMNLHNQPIKAEAIPVAKFAEYAIGDILEINNKKYEVIGFYPDGEPDIKEIEDEIK